MPSGALTKSTGPWPGCNALLPVELVLSGHFPAHSDTSLMCRDHDSSCCCVLGLHVRLDVLAGCSVSPSWEGY